MVLGAIIGGVASSVLGFAGAQSQSNSQNEAARKQYKYDTDVWDYNWDESKRAYKFNKEGNQIARQNNENELTWRDSTALQDWGYGMKIRDHEYLNDMAQFSVGEATYKAQLDLNSSAVASAMDLEDRWFHEQMIENIYQDKDVMMSFGQFKDQENLKNIQGTRDLTTNLNQLTTQENLKYLQVNRDLNTQMAQEMESTFLKSEALNQQQRTERADSAFKSMDNMIAGLQAEGQARNAGNAGRSQAKAVQSAMANVGRTQAQIVDSITRKDAKYNLERRGMAQKLTQSLQTSNTNRKKLQENRTLTVGQAKQTTNDRKKSLDESRSLAIGQATQTRDFNREVLGKQLESAGLRTIANRDKILQDRYQADMDAFAKRLIEPTLSPDLPVPYQLPRTIFQDPLKPEKPPKPIKGAGGASTTTNLLNAGASFAGTLGSINWGS